ncbi:MAG: nucleoside triphosphate pyrophosphatase [Gemmatimonadota bacterium]
MSPRLVLASGSPRRQALFRQLGLEFDVRVTNIEEKALAGERAADTSERLAREKAAAAAPNSGEMVIAADTMVVVDGRVLGKPIDEEDAVRMLVQMSGRSHTVVTGVAVLFGGRMESATDRTEVWFRSLAEAEIRKYVATGEPLDKAGAYGIQGFGAALVKRVEGDFYNVMGLPIHLLLDLLQRFGVCYEFGELEST